MPEPTTPLAERPWENVERMVGVDEALATVLAAFGPLPTAERPLLEALGLVLAEPVVADEDVPPFRNSAMDGFAVRAADAAGASVARPARLRVAGAVAAGDAAAPDLAPGTAIRIMTGARVPDGADAVVRFEETTGGTPPATSAERSFVSVHRAPEPWDNVRPAGEDIAAGSTILTAGTSLRPAELGLLAAIGRTTAPVHRRPRVAIVSTGDEVVTPGERRGPGQIWDSNRFTLAAMAQAWGAETTLLGVAPDQVAALTETLAAAITADLIVTSGGVSLGDYDLVKDVLRAEGDVAIWQVRMKPGKPLAFGRIGATPLLGLPGNPVAAAVSFLLFGRPAILSMLGYRDLRPPTVEARLTERIDNRGQRRHYVRAVVERDPDGALTVRTAGAQGAGVLSSLARANGLLVIPEHLDQADAGSVLPVIALDAPLPATPWHGHRG